RGDARDREAGMGQGGDSRPNGSRSPPGIKPVRAIVSSAVDGAGPRKMEIMGMEQSLKRRVRQLARRRGKYGFDAPFVPFSLGIAAILLLVLGVLGFFVFDIWLLGLLALVCGFIFLLSATGYVYTTRRGKFRVWA